MAITKEMREVLADLNKRFKYELDSEQYGSKEVWTFMELDEVMKGDCEDYSLFVAKELSGGSLAKFYWNLLTRKAKLHYAKAHTGEGHCILEWDGHFVDNNFRRWVTKEDMEIYFKFKYRYCIPVILLKFLMSVGR